MTPRSIRRAQERKALKEMERKALKEMNRQAATTTTTTSEAQLLANRANAQLSTGPTTDEGKTTSSLNAVKTALTGRTVLLPSDDAAEYQRHIQAFATDYSPVGQRECDLVQSIADTWWRLQRIPCLEAALFAQGHLEFANAFEEQEPSLRPSLIQAQTYLKYEKQFRNLQLQESRLHRRYEKDRAELRELQQARQQKEIEAAALSITHEPNQNGFEFSTEQTEQMEAYLAATNTANAIQPPLQQSAQAA